MMSKFKNWACGGALASAVAMSMAAWSMAPAHGMGPDPARMIAHLSDRLDLSGEQQAEVESLVAAAKQGGEADRARLQELRAQMLAMKGNFDPGQAQAIADEIGQITARVVYQASETFARVYQLLNAEQQAELEELMARHSERRGRWGKGDRGPE